MSAIARNDTLDQSTRSAPVDRFVLITDRADRSADLSNILGLAGEVLQVSTSDDLKVTGNCFRVVVDIDLANIDAVVKLRAQLGGAANSSVGRYFVIGEDRHHGTIQAEALGASALFSRPFQAEGMLAGIREDCSNTFAEAIGSAGDDVCVGVSAAHTVLVKIFEGLRAGKGLQLEDVLSQEASIKRALRTSGLRPWLNVVSQHHSSTYRHCLSVTGFAVAFAQHLQFNEHDQRRLARAALLHDIGKAYIPLRILDKPGKLNTSEIVTMRGHSQLGHAALLSQSGFTAEVLDVVLNHHEMLDGSGYPDGLSGSEISDIVRMVTLADIYSALIEERSYRSGMDRQAAFSILEQMRGQLDGDLLKAFRWVALGNS